MDSPSNINYCLYARKSSESDERQAMSIDSQIKEMIDLAKRDNISIKDVYRESHSAKDSGLRHVFNQMIANLGEGVFDGILTWAPDRLSRNAGDLGRIVDLMDRGQMVKDWMDSVGFTTKSGKKITRSMIYLILKNPFYYGAFQFPEKSDVWYKGAHEPIITKEVFDEVQKEISSDKR